MSQILRKTICFVLLISLISVVSSTFVQKALASTPSLVGFGEDLTIYYSNSSPDVWVSKLGYFTKWNANTARLTFNFANDPGWMSIYDKNRMNAVLGYLSSVGVQAVLSYFASGAKYGSQQWVDNWKQVALDFRGDTRIRAFNICNEPYGEYASPTGPTGGIKPRHPDSFNAACGYLIDQIRSIDPTRTIMYPLMMNIVSGSWTEIYNSLLKYGIPAKGNMIYDIVHPYYFENEWDMGLTPTQKADWYLNNNILPAVTAFGAQNCWCGETYPWEWGNHDLQVAFEVQMINNLVDHSVGFQMLCYFSASTYERSLMDECLAASHYYALRG